MMLLGLIGTGLTYRSMREQRLLHEPLRVFRLDPSTASSWQSSPLRVYQNGPHAVVFSVTAPDAATSPHPDAHIFAGAIDVVIEDPEGNVRLNVNASSFQAGIMMPDRLVWFPLDTLRVEHVTSSEWRIQTRITSGDARFAGSRAEVVVVPPHPDAFAPYLVQASYRLYGAGIVLMLGFLLFILGGRGRPSIINAGRA